MTINSREMLVRDIADALQTHVEGMSRWFLNLTEQETGIWLNPVSADPDCPWSKDNDKVIEIKKSHCMRDLVPWNHLPMNNRRK